LEVEKMITGIQILGVLFGLFMLYMTFLYQKRKQLTSPEAVFWGVLWLFFMVLSFLPSSLNFLVKDVLNMQRPLDFLIILGFMFLIGVTFYNYGSVKKNERKLEEVVRRIAFKRAGDK
jgi:hypothetical protein